MRSNHWKYRSVLCAALGGLTIIVTGLWLSALSNPARFRNIPQDDKWIYSFAGGGFACTLLGIGLFLLAVSHTTTALSPEQRAKMNAALGVGLLFQLAGIVMHVAGQGFASPGGMLLAASLPLFIIGALYYAEGKGYSKQFGLLGILGKLGLLVLILIPNRRETQS